MPLKVTLNKYSYELGGPKKETFENVNAVFDMDSGIDLSERNFNQTKRFLYINKAAFESIVVEKE